MRNLLDVLTAIPPVLALCGLGLLLWACDLWTGKRTRLDC